MKNTAAKKDAHRYFPQLVIEYRHLSVQRRIVRARQTLLYRTCSRRQARKKGLAASGDTPRCSLSRLCRAPAGQWVASICVCGLACARMRRGNLLLNAEGPQLLSAERQDVECRGASYLRTARAPACRRQVAERRAHWKQSHAQAVRERRGRFELKTQGARRNGKEQ